MIREYSMENRGKEIQIVGILGGGQLARMIATAAYKLGLQIAILDPAPDSPAQQVTELKVVGPLNDISMIRKVASLSDILTLENEFVDASLLREVESDGVLIYPRADTLGLVQDKLLQKQLLDSNGIRVPRFMAVSEKEDVYKAGETLGWPLVLKARRNGYDGRGNALINGPSSVEDVWRRFEQTRIPLMVEEFVEFKKELAVMVARSSNGEVAVYPVVETIQKNHICHIVKAPAEISPESLENAKEIARKTIEVIDGVGIFGIEMFFLNDERILINELAPRPHNSGHYTIEACVTSQFENHVRAILGLPLGSTSMVLPTAVMVNLLGTRSGPVNIKGLRDALKIPGVSVHVYGKKTTRPGRKMGHVTVLANSIEEALDKATRAAKLISF